MNGQPKFPCETTFYRVGDKVVARCSHQGYTFLEFTGQATAEAEHEAAGEPLGPYRRAITHERTALSPFVVAHF